MDNNFQKLFKVNAWWLHCGNCIHGRILAIGHFNQDAISYMHSLCSELKHFENIEEISLKDDEFDAILINNQPTVLNDKQISNIVDRYLGPQGIASIYETNNGHISNLFKSPLSVIQSLLLKPHSLRFSYHNSQLITNCYPTVSYSGKPHESIHNGMYNSNKNTFLAKEKFKSSLYKTKLISILVNSNILLLRKQGSSKSLLDNINKTLSQTIKPISESEFRCSNILYNKGKLILTYSNKKEDHNGYIIVLALSEDAMKQRDNEKRAIDDMSKNAYFSTLVSSDVYHTDVCGLDCYIMPRMPGITVDIDTPHLEKMTTAAYQVIKKFYSEFDTRNDCDETLKGKLTEYCAKASERLPFLRTLISELESNLNKSSQLEDLTPVVLHGDLKLENLMLNESQEVIGLIDWELYEPESFPLLDLLYLIFYNIQVRNGGDFIDAFYQFTNDSIPDYEKRIFDDYTRCLSLSKDQVNSLLIVFVIHHFGRRVYIDTNNPKQTIKTEDFFKNLPKYAR